MPESRLVIFANGLLPDPDAARRLTRPGDTLVAADGGTRHALELGLVPAVVIGDLDSLQPEDRIRLDEAATRLVAHPRDKDETDLELALRYAVENRFRSILVVGAIGGRLDQTLCNLALLTAPWLAELEVRLDDGLEEAWFVRGCRVAPSRGDSRGIRGEAGEVVSLLPWGADATGVTTQGLRWPLSSETLSAHQSRGISNELLGATASLVLESGLLLVVHRRNRQSAVLSQQS
jgi:thiamine pyrophosphokinase